MTAPLLHLICGSTGAGKTTYSLKLCHELGAVHFAIDEWMATLFAPDRDKPDFPWIAERVERCETLIGTHALQIARLGRPAVLDIGLLRADHRRKWALIALDAGLDVRLHYLDTDPAERWRRVTKRNEQKSETYRFTVTRTMFDFIESIWQPPSPAEMNAINSVRVAA